MKQQMTTKNSQPWGHGGEEWAWKREIAARQGAQRQVWGAGRWAGARKLYQDRELGLPFLLLMEKDIGRIGCQSRESLQHRHWNSAQQQPGTAKQEPNAPEHSRESRSREWNPLTPPDRTGDRDTGAEQRHKRVQEQHQAQGTSQGPIQSRHLSHRAGIPAASRDQTPSPELQGSRAGGCEWRVLVRLLREAVTWCPQVPGRLKAGICVHWEKQSGQVDHRHTSTLCQSRHNYSRQLLILTTRSFDLTKRRPLCVKSKQD